MNSEEQFTDGMAVEHLMRSVFGDRFFGRATPYNTPTIFKRDIKILVTRLGKDIDKLVANEKFKDSTQHYLGRIKDNLNAATTPDDYKKLFISALDIATNLLGYHYESGNKYEEPYFIPSVWGESQGWGDLEEYMQRKEMIAIKRKGLVKQLRLSGCTNAEAAKILNLSNYKLAQIISELKAEGKLQ